MSMKSARDLKIDVLFRASEASNGTSMWDSKAIDYLNRVYFTLAAGASEFLPEYVEDWWWLRDRGSMLLDPVYETGTVTLTNGSTTAVFSDPPPAMADGEWRLRAQNIKNVFVVETFSTPNATLDEAWTGPTGSYSFTLMHVKYTLDESNIDVLMGPIVGFEGTDQIIGVPPERMDFLYPLSRLQPGAPVAFALENEYAPDSNGVGSTIVRFSHGGLKDGTKMKIEYVYKPKITPLTDSATSYPLVPEKWRQILADMALSLIFLDKNDDRSNSIALLARTGLAGMLKENRRRLAKMDKNAGKVITRPQQGVIPGSRVTESGLIIR